MTAFDSILALTLVVLLPLYMLARSLVRRGHPPGDRVRRYRHTLTIIVGLLAATAALWIVRGRPVAGLGLGAPDRVDMLLIAGAAMAVALLAFIAPRAKRPADPARNAAAAAMLPVGGRETRWFLAFAFAAGIGWEVLYRGYLWWALMPFVGGTGAVLIMAVSYGLAHGFRGVGPLIGSLVSALLFAGAYALTGSLWWLIVIHVGLPLVSLRVRPVAA